MKTITFIGAGNMATALVSGLIANQYNSKAICVTNPSQEKLDFFKQQFSVNAETDNIKGAEFADVIVLCVKPQRIEEVCQQLQPILKDSNKLIISVVTGVLIKKFHHYFGDNAAIVRTMPNIASMVGAGATGLCADKNVTADLKQITESIFRAIGIVAWVDENTLDTITAVSGSGPAYIFLVMEAMQQGAVQLGMKDQDAKLFIMQTVLGAAKMAFESGDSFADLRKKVTSPNGTTEKAIAEFEKNNLRQSFVDAMQQAFDRAKQLAGDQ